MELAVPPLSAPAPSSGLAPLTPAQRARQLTVAETPPPRPAPPPQPRNLVGDRNASWLWRCAVPPGGARARWAIRHLAVLMGSGAWETIQFPSGRSVWTTELSRWLICQTMRISMGRPYSSVTRWAVCTDSAVGEPFLRRWKPCGARASTPVRGERSKPQPLPRKRPMREIKPRPRKRPRAGLAPSPPASIKKARVERLKAAMAATGASTSSSSSSSTHLDTSRLAQHGVASHAGYALPVPSPDRRFSVAHGHTLGSI